MTRTAAIEGFGTAVLTSAVVGSGIMGERLAGGNVAVALLANTLATSATLFALIASLAPISGAHFNPAVTGALAMSGRIGWPVARRYVAAQCLGALAGVVAAHAMFDLPFVSPGRHERAGGPQLLSELVATFGLLFVIRTTGARGNAMHAAAAVAAYIAGAYWFTASTSFANPALTIARSLTDTFAGIRPLDVPAFIAAQLAGAAAATAFFGWAVEREPERSPPISEPASQNVAP